MNRPDNPRRVGGEPERRRSRKGGGPPQHRTGPGQRRFRPVRRTVRRRLRRPHPPARHYTRQGRGARVLYNRLREAFPDFRPEIHWQTVDGDVVTTYKIYHGTHLGDFLGVAPTGKVIQFETVDAMRVRDGKITDHWGVANLLLRHATTRTATFHLKHVPDSEFWTGVISPGSRRESWTVTTAMTTLRSGRSSGTWPICPTSNARRTRSRRTRTI